MISQGSKEKYLPFSKCNTCQWYEQRDRNRKIKSLGMGEKQRIEFSLGNGTMGAKAGKKGKDILWRTQTSRQSLFLS